LKVILLSEYLILEKPNEIGLMLNLLNISSPFVTKANFFEKQYINGNKLLNASKLVKNTNGFVSLLPEQNSPCCVKEINVIVKMNKCQDKAYLDSLNATNPIHNVRSKSILNINLPKRNKLNENSLFKLSKLGKYSTKFHKCMTKINSKKCFGPIYVHSNIEKAGGIHDFAMVLKNNGYKDIKAKRRQNRKNFAIIDKSLSKVERKKVLNIYNSKANEGGSIIKILLGSSCKNSQGINNTRELHILDNCSNINNKNQIIKNLSNRNSHLRLSNKQRKLNVFNYIAKSNLSKNKTINEKVMKIEENQIIISKLLKQLLKTSSQMYKKRFMTPIPIKTSKVTPLLKQNTSRLKNTRTPYLTPSPNAIRLKNTRTPYLTPIPNIIRLTNTRIPYLTPTSNTKTSHFTPNNQNTKKEKQTNKSSTDKKLLMKKFPALKGIVSEKNGTHIVIEI
jgi:hypothetical protein